MIKIFAAVGLFVLTFFGQAQAQECKDGNIYKICGEKQYSEYSDLIKEVKAQPDQRILLILGFERCPWCQSMHKYFNSEDGKGRLAAKKLKLLEVGVFDSNSKSVTSGYRILSQALLQSLDNPRTLMNGQEGYPLMVVFDPTKKATVLIRTGDLEHNVGNVRGHDFSKVGDALDKAIERLNVLR